MKKLLLFIFVFLNYLCWSQSNLITITSTVPSQLTICGVSKIFTITIYNPSPFLITNDTLKITMPNGIAYQTGSVTGATYLSTIFPNTKVFLLSNIAALASQNITFMADAQCTVLAYIAGGGITKNNIRVDYTANNIQNYDASITSTYLIKQPYLTITTVTNQSYIGNLGDVFTRCINVVNAGFGELSDFTFTDVHGSGIQITAVNNGVLTNIGTTAKIVLNGTDFSSIGDGDNLFENGESISICETVTVLNCISASSAFKAFWGCSVNACQSSASSANVLFPNYIPNLVITPVSSMNSCIGAGNASPQELKIINTGLGNAINVQLDIFQSTGGGFNNAVGSKIDPSSFTYQTGIAGTPIPITPATTTATSALACMTDPIGMVSLNGYSINAGDTVYIKWNTYSCCWNGCSGIGQNYINGWRYRGTYENVCRNDYIIPETWGRVYSQIYGDLAPDGSPSTLTNGQTGTFNFLFSNYGNSYPAGPGSHWKFEFTLPPLPCLSYSNIQILSSDGVTTWIPSLVSTSGNIVTAVFNGSPPFGLSQAEVQINLTLNCASCTGTDSLSAVSVKSFYIPNSTCGCEIGVSCQSSTVSIVCPDPCSAGMFFNYFEIKRTSYGLPDNEPGGGNGLPDGAGSLNFTKIKTNRAMFGDTVSAMFTGIVNTNFAHPTLQYCYASSSISNGYLLDFLDAQLSIYRGGLLFATCTGFTAVISTTGTTRTFLYDLSVSTLVSSGCLPGGFTNLNDDSLVFIPRYKISVNPGGTILNCYASNKYYLSDVANPTLASDTYQCGNFNGNFSVIGYYFSTNGSDSYYANSCNNLSISQNYYLSIGPGDNNYAGGNLFPYEYRNWAHINILTAIVPPGYSYISARFNQLRTAGTLVANTSPWETITPVNSNSDTLTFIVEQYFQGYGGTIPLGDDGFYGTLEVVIQPSCKVTPSIYQGIQYDWTFANALCLEVPGNDTTFLSASDQIIYDPPVLFLQSVLPSVFALNTTTSWDISISNESNVSNALNAWLSGPTISGVSITQVVDLDNNVIIPPTGSIYQVGTVNATAVRNFRITASFISCAADSIIIYSGWNCNAGYPTSVGTYPCTPEKITLTLTPLTPAFLVNSTGPANIQLCDTADYTAEGVNVQLGTGYNVIFRATLPTGSAIVPGSSKFSYPTANPYTTIPDPVFISGNTWKWDISANDSLIGINGLKGLLEDTLNSFKITFKVIIIPDCSYISGSSIFFVLTGEAACGLATELDITLSPPLDIIGATAPYTTAIKLKTSYVSPCAGNSTMKVVVQNKGAMAFGNADSVFFKLPVGVTFVTGSFNGIYNAPGNGTPLQYSLNGNSYLVWKLPNGTTAADSTVFTFDYEGDPHALSCGIVFFESHTSIVRVITCTGTGISCITTIVTGDTTLAVFTFKAYLSLSNGSATAIPNPPAGETVTIIFDITNTGQAILTDADSIIQFYYDANGNGIYNTGDEFINEDTIMIPKDSILHYSTTFNVPAGQACSIIAIIDPAVNACVCNPSQLLILPSLIGLNNDSTLCSIQTIILGSPPVTGYSYSWTPLTGLSDASIANPTLTTSNLTSVPVSTTYILATNRIGCISSDTIVITVNPLPTATINGTIAVCKDAPAPNITFTGATGTAPYTFIYSINGGPNQSATTTNGDTATITIPTTVADTLIISLLSVQEGGLTACSQAQFGSATVTVNPLPVATISGTTAICKNTSTPNVIFTGVSGTAPYTFTYTINGGTNQTISTTFGNSVTVSVPTVTSGTYIYSLVSIQDASSTACSQIQTGNATITVYPLPVSNFGFEDVCLNQGMLFYDSSIVASGTIAAWSWNFGDNSPSDTMQNPIYLYSSFGTYNVTLISTTNNGCNDTISKSAVVHPLPIANFYTTPVSIGICNGTSVQFNDTSTIIVPDILQSWVWTFGDASPTNLNQNTSHLYASANSYNVQLVVVSDFGCLDSIAKTIIINPNPTVYFSGSPVAGCEPLCVSFSDSSSVAAGSNTHWTWDVGDGSSTNNSTNFEKCYTNDSIYSAVSFNVSLTVTSDSGCVSTLSKNNYITVYPNPIADFSVDPEKTTVIDPVISFINLSTGVDFWNWDFGDLNASAISNPSPHRYPADTATYLITLITSTQYSCIDTAYQTVFIEADFVFYIPNAFTPNEDGINDYFFGTGIGIAKYDLWVFDRWGNIIFHGNELYDKWDGRMNGGQDVAQIDVYVWKVALTDVFKKVHNYIGTVTLVK